MWKIQSQVVQICFYNILITTLDQLVRLTKQKIICHPCIKQRQTDNNGNPLNKMLL